MYVTFSAKLLFELILPVNERIKQVTEFLMAIDSSLKYEVVPIQDAFGPTKSDPRLDVRNIFVRSTLN